MISILAPHEGERPQAPPPAKRRRMISILAPHEGERRRKQVKKAPQSGISILAPHEGERRDTQMRSVYERVKFQSSLPTRGSDWMT